MRAINKDRIIEARINEPYVNCGEAWDYISSRGWQVVLIVGYLEDGQERPIHVEKETKEQCEELIKELGFVIVN
jgi:hypothetical protein